VSSVSTPPLARFCSIEKLVYERELETQLAVSRHPQPKPANQAHDARLGHGESEPVVKVRRVKRLCIAM
jgi:hypothetical protein